MNTQDASIVKACQKGKTEEFTVLYDKYAKKIYDFIYYKTHHKETAEDLTSLTFTKVLRKINSYDPEMGKFSSWLYRIARNSVIDHYRTFKVERDVADIWDLAANEDVERDVDAKLKVEVVEEYVSELTEDQRNILIMRLWQGLSHAEIADALGKTEASVKMKYSRLMAKLRKEMPLSAYIALLLIQI